MSKASDKYLSKISGASAKIDLDFEVFWNYVDMVHFSPIFTCSLHTSKDTVSPSLNTKGSSIPTK